MTSRFPRSQPDDTFTSDVTFSPFPLADGLISVDDVEALDELTSPDDLTSIDELESLEDLGSLDDVRSFNDLTRLRLSASLGSIAESL